MIDSLFINGRFLAQRVTGVQRFAVQTLAAIDALLSAHPDEAPRGSRVVVLVPRGARPTVLRNISIRRVGVLTGHAWEQWSLPRATGASPLLSFGPTGPLLKRRQVVTIHDAAIRAVPEAYSPAFRAWYEFLLPALVRRSPFVMTVSNFSKSEVIRHFGARDEQVRVTGEGWQHIDTVRPDRRVLERHGLTPGGYVLAVGSITPNKNFGVVARAMKRLGNTAGFTVAVAGSVDRTLFADVDARSMNSFEWLGYVNDQELRALYESAGAFVFPSLYEGFGLPPLEAMAAGCPVIASSAAAISEVCGDAALYFEPRDDVALAGLLLRVMSSPEERLRLVASGRRRLERYSWEKAARAYLSMIADWERRWDRVAREHG